MSAIVTKRDDDHRSRELRALDHHYWGVHRQGLLVGTFRNGGDTHAYRIKLEEEKELRQIGGSA